MENLKVCSRCGNAKPTTEFYTLATAKDGLRPHCKECHQKGLRNSDTPRVRIKPEAMAGVNKRPQFHQENPLSAFTPRELMAELHRRGYEGELSFVSRINISNM